MSVPRLVLASASPRRLDILRQLGLAPEVRAADVDESLLPGEGPGAHVERLARAKAARVAAASDAGEPELVLAGDTVVVLEGAVLGKPRDPAHAEEMLLALAGREHEVWSGLAVAGPDGSVSGAARAVVRFRPFDAALARAYVATGEPLDKAGAYGIQGMGAALVEEVRGDYYSVVGLPVGLLVSLLARAGWRYGFGRLEPLPDPAPGGPDASFDRGVP